MTKEIVTVRNVGSEPIPLLGQYLLAGETRQVSLPVAEAALANHQGRLVILNRPALQPEVIEPAAEVVTEAAKPVEEAETIKPAAELAESVETDPKLRKAKPGRVRAE